MEPPGERGRKTDYGLALKAPVNPDFRKNYSLVNHIFPRPHIPTSLTTATECDKQVFGSIIRHMGTSVNHDMETFLRCNPLIYKEWNTGK